jgi:hypothetical protein
MNNKTIAAVLTAVIFLGVVEGASSSILHIQYANAFSIFGFLKHLFPKHHSNSNNAEQKNINSSSTLSSQTQPSSPGKCDQSLWNHVHHPSRLQVVDPCKTVSGIIESKRVEKDGDFHIRLKVDPQFANLIVYGSKHTQRRCR